MDDDDDDIEFYDEIANCDDEMNDSAIYIHESSSDADFNDPWITSDEDEMEIWFSDKENADDADDAWVAKRRLNLTKMNKTELLQYFHLTQRGSSRQWREFMENVIKREAQDAVNALRANKEIVDIKPQCKDGPIHIEPSYNEAMHSCPSYSQLITSVYKDGIILTDTLRRKILVLILFMFLCLIGITNDYNILPIESANVQTAVNVDDNMSGEGIVLNDKYVNNEMDNMSTLNAVQNERTPYDGMALRANYNDDDEETLAPFKEQRYGKKKAWNNTIYCVEPPDKKQAANKQNNPLLSPKAADNESCDPYEHYAAGNADIFQPRRLRDHWWMNRKGGTEGPNSIAVREEIDSGGGSSTNEAIVTKNIKQSNRNKRYDGHLIHLNSIHCHISLRDVAIPMSQQSRYLRSLWWVNKSGGTHECPNSIAVEDISTLNAVQNERTPYYEMALWANKNDDDEETLARFKEQRYGKKKSWNNTIYYVEPPEEKRAVNKQNNPLLSPKAADNESYDLYGHDAAGKADIVQPRRLRNHWWMNRKGGTEGCPNSMTVRNEIDSGGESPTRETIVIDDIKQSNRNKRYDGHLIHLNSIQCHTSIMDVAIPVSQQSLSDVEPINGIGVHDRHAERRKAENRKIDGGISGVGCGLRDHDNDVNKAIAIKDIKRSDRNIRCDGHIIHLNSIQCHISIMDVAIPVSRQSRYLRNLWWVNRSGGMQECPNSIAVEDEINRAEDQTQRAIVIKDIKRSDQNIRCDGHLIQMNLIHCHISNMSVAIPVSQHQLNASVIDGSDEGPSNGIGDHDKQTERRKAENRKQEGENRECIERR